MAFASDTQLAASESRSKVSNSLRKKQINKKGPGQRLHNSESFENLLEEGFLHKRGNTVTLSPCMENIAPLCYTRNLST